MNCEQCGVSVGLFRVEVVIQPCGPRHVYCSALCVRLAVNGEPECAARLAAPTGELEVTR